MEVLTGSQGTREQRDDLAELAGRYGLVPVSADTSWWDVDRLYCAPGWDTCPHAQADVLIAAGFGITAVDLHGMAPAA
jgi:hypothetical protein